MGLICCADPIFVPQFFIVSVMDDMEDGELPDSPTRLEPNDDTTSHGDAIDAPYTPLLRPESVKNINNIVTRPRSATNSSTVANMGDISGIF